jgi:hypothetical protein
MRKAGTAPKEIEMPQNSGPNHRAVSCAELAYANTLTLQAVVALLSEKGLFGWKEVFDRVQKLKGEAVGGSAV